MMRWFAVALYIYVYVYIYIVLYINSRGRGYPPYPRPSPDGYPGNDLGLTPVPSQTGDSPTRSGRGPTGFFAFPTLGTDRSMKITEFGGKTVECVD